MYVDDSAMIGEFKSITVPVLYTLVNFDEVQVLSPDTLPDSRAAVEGVPLTIQPNSSNGGSLSDLLLDPMTCIAGREGRGLLSVPSGTEDCSR